MALRRTLAPAFVVAALLIGAPTAPAQLLRGYDGSNPFDCELQNVGFGTDFPHPEADPFCVEFDKRRQNLTELGLVDFLLQEPARVAAALPKCFYYQHDHWTGYVVQDDQTTETYSWDGSYYFDKASGAGGVYVENFTFNNQTSDPRLLPGFPDDLRPYFGPGRGGVQGVGNIPADPRCERRAAEPPPGGPYRCRELGGRIGRGLAGVAPGMSRAEVRRVLGEPPRSVRGFDRFCLMDGGKLAVGFPTAAGGRARLVLTTSPAFDAFGVRPGAGARAARRSLRGECTLMRRGSSTVLAVARGSRRILVGLRSGRVSYLALADSRLTTRQLSSYLTRSR